MELANFDVASDAFSTFKVRSLSHNVEKASITLHYIMVSLTHYHEYVKQDLLTKHPIAVSEFLTSHYNEVCFSLLKSQIKLSDSF